MWVVAAAVVSVISSVLSRNAPPADGTTPEFSPRWVNRSILEREFPHTLLIELMKNRGMCSGSLLSERWLLTAARCMYSEDNVFTETDHSITVYAGVKDRFQLQGPKVQIRRSKKLRIYQEKSLANYYSLALVEVSQPFNLGKEEGVETIEVSDYSFSNGEDQRCKTGSFGNIHWKNDANDSEMGMKKLEISMRTCKCRKQLKAAAMPSSVSNWICGRSDFNVGICRGDFGAGVICDSFLQAVAVDIVNIYPADCSLLEIRTHKCGNQNTEAISVDLCPYAEWLHEYVPSINPYCYRSCALNTLPHLPSAGIVLLAIRVTNLSNVYL